MKKVSLSGSSRKNVGKKDAKALRNAGRVPGVLYGGDKQISFSVAATDFDKIYYTPNVYQVVLEIDGEEKRSIIKDLQLHPLTGSVVHIDLYELHDGKAVEVSLPIHTTGTAIGVVAGGTLVTNYRKIKVLGLPKDLPGEVIVDVSDLEIGDFARISDIEIANCIINQNQSSVVLAVKNSRAAMALDTDEEGVEGEEATAEGGETAEGEKAAE